jgi:hypothetical protein
MRAWSGRKLANPDHVRAYGDMMSERLKSTLKYIGIVILGLLLGLFLIKTLESFLQVF